MISVGIDVSKGKSTVCMLKPYGEVVASPFEVVHTESSVQKLVEQIQAQEGEVKIVMEATGAYHLPLLDSFKQAGLFVSTVNPLAMKKYASIGLRKGKTDKLDALRIANYGIDNWFKLEDYTAPEEVYAQLRILGRQYYHYINMKVQSKLSLTHLVDRTMPGIKKLIKSNNSDEPTKDKFGDFIEEYWHYNNITKKSERRFITSYCSWAKKKGYHASEAKAKAIYDVARDGIPTLPSDAASTKMLTLEAVRILKEINRTLDTILTQMQELATALPEYGVVRAMKGVGNVLASKLIEDNQANRRCGSLSIYDEKGRGRQTKEGRQDRCTQQVSTNLLCACNGGL